MTTEELNEKVRSIYAEMEPIEERHKAELKPYRERIKELEENFIDEYLKDSNGEVIRCGMEITGKDGCTCKVLKRGQQHIFQYMGNVQMEILKEGKKRSIRIGYREAAEFTIKRL